MFQRRTAAAVLALSLVLAACGGSGGDSAPDATAQSASASPGTPASEPTAPEDASVPSGGPSSIAERIRQRTMDLWDVYNTHDVDALKAFYEESYWQKRKEDIQSDMQPFKIFGMTITAEEAAPPREISPGKWEIRHLGSFGVGTVNMVFVYEEVDGEWMIIFDEGE